MSTLRLALSMDNEAFGDEPGGEVARILSQLATRIRASGLPDDALKLRDINGNAVGLVQVEE